MREAQSWLATIARAATSKAIMRFIIEARIVDEESSGKPVVLAEFGRKTGGMLDSSRIGMTLQEGHELLREAQQVFAQAYGRQAKPAWRLRPIHLSQCAPSPTRPFHD